MLLHNFACMPCSIKHTSNNQGTRRPLQVLNCACTTSLDNNTGQRLLTSTSGDSCACHASCSSYNITCLEATAELSSGQLKNSCGPILAGGGQVLAVRRHSHGIQTLLGDIQGCGWTPLWTGRQCFHSKAAFAAAGFLSLQDSSSHEAPCVRDCGV